MSCAARAKTYVCPSAVGGDSVVVGFEINVPDVTGYRLDPGLYHSACSDRSVG